MRPTCGTCKHLVLKREKLGTCRAGLPAQRVVYIVPRPEDDPNNPVRVQTSWGTYPLMGVDEPCCGHHQGFEDWWKAEGSNAGPVVACDNGITAEDF